MNIRQNVQEYYGERLQTSADLRTDACCTLEAAPAWLREALRDVHPEVKARYYGCGLIAPLALEGRRVLDLGCGAGQDVYVLSRLVGGNGSVVGVDMTPAQLAVARAHEDWHAERYGYAKPNVTFLEGDIERLSELGLEEASFDVIVSNCVVNLCTDKRAVFAAAHALLKPGGEFYFSDVYADRRLPASLREDPIAHGECLAGALYWNDFLQMAKAAGFPDPRLVSDRPLAIGDAALAERVAPARFYSATYRLFRIEELEPACEDYGQAVVYKGGLPHAEQVFALDSHHVIEKGRIFPVCGNTFRMLRESRFAPWFDFIGDWSTHYGIFPGCGASLPFGRTDAEAATSGACC
ncbi:methyltransferase domain-containing protein [Amphiplicatus metriothermophilus]|uniref:Arsenite methyltransferase n=1 Tax=Amphiplicatus metriothermophilus TaxID=1519374 RepID=A0A239PX27_9PROT|nr:Methyltransferase domain-containing protein [Amphiplicatus metriothermophilus]